MLPEPLPIELFVSARFLDRDVIAILENWRVERDDLQKLLVGYFKDMGIFSILPHMEIEAKRILKLWLKRGPEIYQMVRKSELQEKMRRQSRKATD